MDSVRLNARELRNNMTNQERKLWAMLKNKSFYGFKFRRQYPIGNYIVDFICCSEKIIIEIDGGQHNNSENIEYDEQRTRYLESRGYRVLRFWNSEINENISGVYKKLQQEFKVVDI
ncbi:MAG: hypothetical protein BHW62_07175 [Acinetobacter sp. CAG:196_36_41]|nr:MAG: hypothetical protein BHW62_07175 [Acinetobacter sp. CAG:196_36_41]